jgi:hypothetical protein
MIAAVCAILARTAMSDIRAALPSDDEIARLPPDGGPGFNRLIHEKSPYLLQHARNPVDWFPWRPEAFAKAGAENKPVFLSVGYSACHWCHVMEHESFEDGRVAEILNRHFVCIKVDREERPDIDDIYMTATQLMTGRGGWPNSVWLTPDQRPWYAGTYFPREDRHGRPGFITLLTRLAEVWRLQRNDVEAQAERLAEAVRANAGAGERAAHDVSRDRVGALIADGVNALERSYDLKHGGFGDAPKFPPHSALRLLLRRSPVTDQRSLLPIATGTLDAMMLGGIHDHVGGGFHRYSTDARWLLPHFEKMLYDNAQLARVYAEAFRITGNEAFRATARDTLDWALREMRDPGGGFFSALDADSEGEEGRFYVWTRGEVLEILGREAGESFCNVYHIEDRGNFREEATGEQSAHNIPYLESGADIARLEESRKKLLAGRARRARPGLDDKVLTSWNGLMIGALAHAGRHLDEPRYLDAARQAAGFALARLIREGRVLHGYRSDSARGMGFLDDYACLADGLLDLFDATGEERRLKEAESLAQRMLRHFPDEARGGFFYTADDHERLLTRGKDAFDQAMPSGNGVAARVFVRLGVLLKNRGYLETGGDTVKALAPAVERAPAGACSLLLAAQMYLDALPASDATARQAPLTVDAHVTRDAGSHATIILRLFIDRGWQVNSNRPQDAHLVPATVESDVPVEVSYPAGARWTGAVELRVVAARPAIARNASITLRVQPCDETRCLAPIALRLSIPVR